MLVFCGGRKTEPEDAEKNPRNENDNQQQTQPICDAGYWNPTRVSLVDGGKRVFPPPRSPRSPNEWVNYVRLKKGHQKSKEGTSRKQRREPDQWCKKDISMFSIFYKVVCLLANMATRYCQILKKTYLFAHYWSTPIPVLLSCITNTVSLDTVWLS